MSAKRNKTAKAVKQDDSMRHPLLSKMHERPAMPTAKSPDSLILSINNVPAPEDAASSFFLFCYAPAGPMACLPMLATIYAPDHVLLVSAMLAPALAILSHECKQPSLMRLAREHYTTALKEINLALASPELVTNDATLASVLLLALFEAVAFQRSRSLHGWTVHVDGAAELLKIRGPGQFESALGRALFLDVISGIYASCAQRRIATPAVVSDLWVQLRKITGEDSPEVGMARVADSMANLLARMRTCGEEPLENEVIVRQGRDLDTQIEHLLEQLRKPSPYQILPRVDIPGRAYNKVAHNYESAQAARHWNVLRMMRMFVNKWIHRAASAMRDVSEGAVGTGDILLRARLLEVTARISEHMAIDILGSAPFFLPLPSSCRHSNQSAARWLIWPLSAVAVSVLVPASARMYARNSLQVNGKDAGISHAAEALKMVDDGRSLEDWYV